MRLFVFWNSIAMPTTLVEPIEDRVFDRDKFVVVGLDTDSSASSAARCCTEVTVADVGIRAIVGRCAIEVEIDAVDALDVHIVQGGVIRLVELNARDTSDASTPEAQVVDGETVAECGRWSLHPEHLSARDSGPSHDDRAVTRANQMHIVGVDDEGRHDEIGAYREEDDTAAAFAQAVIAA